MYSWVPMIELENVVNTGKEIVTGDGFLWKLRQQLPDTTAWVKPRNRKVTVIEEKGFISSSPPNSPTFFEQMQ